MSQLTTSPDAALPHASAASRTIPRLWREAVAAGNAIPAYLVERDGAWQEVPFSVVVQVNAATASPSPRSAWNE